MNIVKYILPVVAGCIVGITLISFGEMGLHHFYSLPNDIDTHNRQAFDAAIKAMPVSVFLMLLIVYAFASFASGLVASLATGRESSRPAVIVGIVLTIVGTIRTVKGGNPIWFTIANLLAYIPFAYLGFLTVRRRNVSTAA